MICISLNELNECLNNRGNIDMGYPSGSSVVLMVNGESCLECYRYQSSFYLITQKAIIWKCPFK